MIIRRPSDIRSSEITSENAYLNRRGFLSIAGGLAIGVAGTAGLGFALRRGYRDGQWVPSDGEVDNGVKQEDKPNTYEQITTYNNFYEFGTDRDEPAQNATDFKTKPWTVKVDGLVKKPATYQLEDLLKPHKVEDRVYRLRCVEAWSMVIPWQGIPLATMINRFEPLPSAKFVQFTTLMDPSQMPGERRPILPWPYVEGLRMDEAMHPLTLMVTGLYGKQLPNQNGAPFRLVVPWKYGFKGIKSIVRISFVDKQPQNTWQLANPDEYGFYANVNPTVDHPRWTQASERRIGEFRRRETLMFNGYADQVAHLYAGMDLRK